jgi:DNA-binding response OmpR family regulator
MPICSLPEAIALPSAPQKKNNINTACENGVLQISSSEATPSPSLGSFRVAVVSMPDSETKQEIMNTSSLLILSMPPDNLLHEMTHYSLEVQTANSRQILKFGDVQVDLQRYEIHRGNQIVMLTALEFKVLKFFLFRPHQVVSRLELLDTVWGYSRYTVTRTVDNQILRLRKKLEQEPAHPVHFRTIHGVGYKFIP